MTETDFPEHFVAWHEWPGWIHDPLDQRNCAASWAFSTASNMLLLVPFVFSQMTVFALQNLPLQVNLLLNIF